jgi:hypothetical protein
MIFRHPTSFWSAIPDLTIYLTQAFPNTAWNRRMVINL